MNAQQSIHRSPTTTEALPEELGSPRAKLVYLYLDVLGPATVQDLQDYLDMRKIDLLSVLGSLKKDGHVDADGTTYAIAN